MCIELCHDEQGHMLRKINDLEEFFRREKSTYAEIWIERALPARARSPAEEGGRGSGGAGRRRSGGAGGGGRRRGRRRACGRRRRRTGRRRGRRAGAEARRRRAAGAGGGARPEAGHVALAGWPGGAADVSGAGGRVRRGAEGEG